jgi:hypothetical protein
MRISNRTLFSTGAALFALSLAVHADVILRSDLRSVRADSSTTTLVASGEFRENIDKRIDSLGDFSPFNADVNANLSDGGLSVNATADQSSEVTSTSISGRGSANANADASLNENSSNENSSTDASTFLSMDFELTSPTDFRLTGNVDAEADPELFTAYTEVGLSRNGAGVSLSLSADPLTGPVSLDVAGILPAGSYLLFVSANAFASTNEFSANSSSSASEFSFLLEFPGESITLDPRPIPIPGAALLFGSGLLAFLGRLRFRSA